jgi:hypothetical protein
LWQSVCLCQRNAVGRAPRIPWECSRRLVSIQHSVPNLASTTLGFMQRAFI